jgi:type II secretory pathway predicted ATPase ExeA
MLSQYFGFKEEPFGFSPDPRCLFLSRTHQQALEALEEGFSSNRGFTAMIAPPGMGKTTLLFRFLEDVRESARVVFLFDLDATCEPREFVAYVLRDLGITPAQGSAEMHDQLSEALIKENIAGRKFVIVIDEAQNLSEAVLERVRLLTNFENSRGKLIQVVFSGQPQLSGKLLQSSLIQLRQRISTVCHIDPLSAEEIAGYIDYRVKMAGYLGRSLFAEDAIKLIAEASQGTPRVINNLCYKSLALCSKLKSRQVDAAMVAQVITALQLVPQSNVRAAAAVDVPVASAAGEAAGQPRKSREFAGLRLAPESDSSAPADRKKPAAEPAMPRFWERTRLRLVSFASATAGSAMIWVPAAAIMLVISFAGIVRITEVLSPPSHATGADQTQDLSVPPPSESDDPGATESTAPSDPGNPVSAPAAAPRPMQAASAPKPSPSTARPAASNPMQSASSGSSQKSLQGSPVIPAPAVAAQPVVMAPQANVQPRTASSSVTPAVPQQASALPVASAPKQVRAALAGDAPQPGSTGAAASSVHPALPQR